MIPVGVLSSYATEESVFPTLDVPFLFEADSLSLSNNDPVSTWPDTSGNGRDATQATGANQPTFQSAAFGGKGGVLFGAGTWMKTAAFTAVAQPNVVFFVGSFAAGGYAFDGLVSTQRHFVNAHWSLNHVLEFGSPEVRYKDNLPIYTTPRVWAFRYNGLNNGFIYPGGGTRYIVSGTIGTQPLGGLTLGAHYQNGGSLGATMGALIVCHTSSLSDINLIGGYLGVKYGLPWSDVTS